MKRQQHQTLQLHHLPMLDLHHRPLLVVQCSHIHHYHHHTLSDELQGAVDAIVAVPVPMPDDIAIVVSSRSQNACPFSVAI